MKTESLSIDSVKASDGKTYKFLGSQWAELLPSGKTGLFAKKKIGKYTDVYLVDTYGEAKKFLGLSKVIFTGGSIIPHGGQNPLDAVRNNSIVIHGPNIQNFTEIYKFLSKEKMSFKFKK